MKLVRFNTNGNPRTGALFDNGVVDLHIAAPQLLAGIDPGDTIAVIGLDRLAIDTLGNLASAAPRITDFKLLAPIIKAPKIVCAWVNYPNPAVKNMPEVPIFFSKYNSAIIGPGDNIVLPHIGDDIVVEPELTAVIGKPGRHISEADALQHVAGYTIVNDVTAFSHRLQNFLGSPGPYMMAKTFDSFAPIGPCITTADEIDDPHTLHIQQWQNGNLMTEANSAEAIFKLPRLISYLSDFMTLETGDLILTGSPPPNSGKPAFLNAGDTINIEISSIGVLTNPVIAEQ